MNLKKELRLTLRAQRDGIEADKRRAFSELICKSCLSLPEYTSAKVVLLYFPTGSEADLSLLAEDALQSGKTVAYPRVEGKGMMTFFSITSLSMLEKGYFGIMEPKKEAPPCETNGAICFVPAIAFDERGYRLGYGGGFYDRFLEEFNGISVGITFEDTLKKSLPAEHHDKKTDYIITESRVKKTIED